MMIRTNWIRKTESFFLLFVFGAFSCTKFVQIDPPTTAIASSTVYSDNTSAAAAMTSIYTRMISNSLGLSDGNQSISCLMGLAADELKNYSPTNITYSQFYLNAWSSMSNNNPNYYFWRELYQEIYVANAVLDGLEKSTGLSAAVRDQITGEAKFMRAFLNFYATNLYGDVPLLTTTSYLVNNSIRRSPAAEVYQLIIADLKDAQYKLSDNFLDALGNVSTQRVRPNRGAATALLARAYLFTGAYDSAETQATAVINYTANYSLDSLDNVFLATSREAIWQFQSINPGYNTFDAHNFVLTSAPGTNGSNVALNSILQNAFEAGDARFTHWLGVFTDDSVTYYYYPFKYKIWEYSGDASYSPTEYTTVLRLAEQYLIRAEAEANGAAGGVSAAIVDLNVIRNRAGLSNYNGATDPASVLNAIYHERQVELFTEWGSRWFDLKRTGNLNSVMGSPGNVCQEKGGVWNPDWSLLPLPESEIKINPNLTQNPGYPD